MASADAPKAAISLRDYSKDALIHRVLDLETQLKAQTIRLQKLRNGEPSIDHSHRHNGTKAPEPRRPFDFSKHSTRYIALKIAYRGRNYNGFEWSGQITPQPTIEEELWNALTKSTLVPPGEVGVSGASWNGLDYSKCGRTDRGVSALGQVIAVNVRSARPKPSARLAEKPVALEGLGDEGEEGSSAEPVGPGVEDDDGSKLLSNEQGPPFDDILDELPYATILNRLLPPEIRVLAWCPHPPPNFSARFSCRERQYKYFFTVPACRPSVSPQAINGASDGSLNRYSGVLDIARMKDAAQRFVGVRDFRNFCKLDDSKQITNFQRRIFEASIQEEDHGTWSFKVSGSAFLWHQVRHMVAILFLVGQGLEEPSLVSDLLDIEKNPRKPGYQMAAEAPLVLWDCVFPALDAELKEIDAAYPKRDALQWILTADVPYKPGDPESARSRYGPGSLADATWEPWRRAKIDEILAWQMMQRAEAQLAWSESDTVDGAHHTPKRKTVSKSKGGILQPVFGGGDKALYNGDYQPVMSKPLLLTIDEQNARNLRRQSAKQARRSAVEPESS